MINNNDNFFRRAEIERERQIITYRMKKAKDDGIELGKREGIYHTLLKMLFAFYPNEDTQWIENCSLEQLTLAIDLILTHPDYQELKQTILSY